MSIGKYGGWLLAGLFLYGWLTSDGTEPPTPSSSSTQEETQTAPQKPSYQASKEPKTQAPVGPRIGLKPTQVKLAPIKKEEKPPVSSISSSKTNTKTMYVDASRLNVRTGPGKKSKVIWTIKRDEAVQVVAQSGSWREIKGDRYRGWVYGTYLTAKPSPNKQKPNKQIAKSRQQSAAAIKKILIKRSVAYYSGNCPCPYNHASNGSRCGRRSAYSRPGGASPLCYPSDVTATMVTDYRARQ